jgi:outer membrane protein assembly factor BamB/tetratricopeptide (TPR) repeat protein
MHVLPRVPAPRGPGNPCRGHGLLFILASGLALALGSLPVRGQTPDDAVKLSTDADAGRTVDAAEEYFQKKNWESGTKALQKLLDAPTDPLISILEQQGDKSVVRYSSARTEAARMLAGLPKEGQAYYQVTFDPAAEALLKEARKQNPAAGLLRLVERYPLTRAADEALDELARLAESEGESHRAARALERRLQGRTPASWTAAQLYLAAMVFTEVGDKTRADAVVKVLKPQLGKDGMKIGDNVVRPEDLAKELESLAPSATVQDWPLLGGNPERTAQARGAAPFLGPVWKKELTTSEEVLKEVKKSEAELLHRHQAVLPAASPVVVTDPRRGVLLPIAIYTSYSGVNAVQLRTGEPFWKSGSSWRLENLFRKAETITSVTGWLERYRSQQRPGVVFENSVITQMSTNGRFVYVVDDLAFPPPRSFQAEQPFPGGYVRNSDKLNGMVFSSRLQAYDLFSGKLRWELGGDGEKAGELGDSHFLSAPLPVENRLYLLTQKDKEIRLATLEWASGKVVTIQPLVSVTQKLVADPNRRMRAAHLAMGKGVLVCSTNAGAVAGVDLLTGATAWVHVYREAEAPKPPPFRIVPAPIEPQRRWQGSPPLILDDRVVLASVDSPSIDCLDLRTGSRLWSVPRSELDLFLGGVAQGKVLVVGSGTCRALDLGKGTELWSLKTGVPSGHGALAQDVFYLPLRVDVFYLPLRVAAISGKPAICVIDLNGRVRAHIHSKNDAIPGNLVFAHGLLLSQTTREIRVYAEMESKVKEIDVRLKLNPRDPQALGERGILRLDQGNVVGAIEDWREILAGKLTDAERLHFQRELFDALSELLQRDFKAGEKFLADYRALGNMAIPANLPEEAVTGRKAELKRRQALIPCIIGRGQEAAGKLVDALETYLDLAGQEVGAPVASPDDPSLLVARAVWARGRVQDLMTKKDEAARRQLEEDWKVVRNTTDIDVLRGFAEIFAGTAHGREARMLLAERFIKEKLWLKAQHQLEFLRSQNEDPVMAGRAVLKLAHIADLQGRLPDAVAYFKILKRDFGDAKNNEGKTGAELFEELQNDKRYLPYLEETSFPRGKISVKQKTEKDPNPPMWAALTPLGQASPFWQRHQLRIDPRLRKHLTLVERGIEEELWRTPAHRPELSFQTSSSDEIESVVPFQMVGDFVVLTLPTSLLGIDPIQKRIVWERDLCPIPVKGNTGVTYDIRVDPLDNTRLVTFSDRSSHRFNQPGSVAAGCVCSQSAEGLHGIDPLTGKTLWTRTDLPSAMHLFGNDDHVFLVEQLNGPAAPRSLALRRSDGSRVRVPEFGALYHRQVGRHGRSLLVRDIDAGGKVTLRLYDALTGKDVWSKTFPPKTIIAASEEPRLTGSVQPDGKVVVLNIANGEVVLQSQLKESQVKDLAGVTLLGDEKNLYLALRTPTDPVRVHGAVFTNLAASSGWRSEPINGDLVALDRKAGNPLWSTAMRNQRIVLDPAAELPVIVLASLYRKGNKENDPSSIQLTQTLCIVDRATGEKLYDSEKKWDSEIQTIGVDARKGQVYIRTVFERITATVEKESP